jgi:hypothetical protein
VRYPIKVAAPSMGQRLAEMFCLRRFDLESSSSVKRISSSSRGKGNSLTSRLKGSRSVRGADKESQRDCSKPAGLGDLAEVTLTDIFCLMKPADVARLACVNRSFRNAAYSDLVWQRMLPPSYNLILAQTDGPEDCSKKELFDFLTAGVILENGNRKIWLHRATGGVCHSIGAKDLNISCYDSLLGYPSGRLPQFICLEGSTFAEVECISARRLVIDYSWEEALQKGSKVVNLSPGTYALFWRLCLTSERQKNLGSGPPSFAKKIRYRLLRRRKRPDLHALMGAALLNRGSLNQFCKGYSFLYSAFSYHIPDR